MIVLATVRPQGRGGGVVAAGCVFCLFGCFVSPCLWGRDGEGDVISLRT